MKARQSATWWRRVGVAALALVLFGFVYLEFSRWANPSWIGRQLFSALAGFGMGVGLLAGPLVTTDCLARERREGTLGLLFLTPLRSYDIVLGKMAAGSLDMVLAALAILPILSVPLLIGGVTLLQFTCTGLALLNIIFLSLAIGVFASSWFASGRLALALSLVILGVITLGLPLIGEGCLRLHLFSTSRGAPFYYSVCPLQTMVLCLDGLPRRPTWLYWLNMSGLQVLAWLCLLMACVRMWRSWRDVPASAFQQWCRKIWEGWNQGSAGWRLGWRKKMLERNAFGWLEGRDRMEGRILWGLMVLATVLWLWQYLHHPHWLDVDVAILWPLFAHYILCLWIAIRAPRRLADDKRSGALELLLCTPLKEREIIRGSMQFLWRRFGRAVMTALALGLGGVWLHITTRGRPTISTEVVKIACCGLVVVPIQAYSFARVGLYQGLAQSNSLRATFWLIGQLGVLPWAMFIGYVLAWEMLRSYWRWPRNMTDAVAFGSWAGIHVLVCGWFLAHANWQLHGNFRLLAAQAVRLPWWKRWGLLRRG